jgi:peptide/nickel transport system permease protein
MTQYILRRLLLVPVLLLGITLIGYVINNLAPGDPISVMIDPRDPAYRQPLALERLRKDLGLDKPIMVRYALWLKEVLRGNLGYSYQSKKPVLGIILRVLPATLLLQSTSLFMAITVGISLGIICALKQYSIVDHSLTVAAFFGVSIPGFFFALLGIYIFAVKLGWFPVGGMWTPGEPTGFNLDLLRHLVLPAAVEGILQVAFYMRYARASTLDALTADYVVTARAKGLRERIVIGRHVFRNALLPLVTILGLSLPALLGGSFIIETIFSWPGMGMLGYTALMQRDYPVQMGVALIAATLVLLANLITDIAYAVVDPRVRYQ